MKGCTVIRNYLKQYKKMPLTVRAALAYTICSILQRSLSIIAVILFTRMLTTEEYGQVSVYGSWQGIMTVFITLQVPYGTFSTAMLKYEDRRNQYTSCAQFFCVMMGGIAVAVITIFRSWFSQVFELPYYIIVFMIAEIVANAIILCWFARDRFEYKYRSVVIFTVVQSMIGLLLMFLFVICSKERGYAKIVGNSLNSIIFGSIVLAFSIYIGKKIFVWEFLKYIVKFNLPLLPYYLSQIIFNSSDRIMISNLKSTSDAGIYSIAFSLGMLMNFILTAVLNAYQPWFFYRIKDGTAVRHKKNTTWIALGMAILVIGLITATPEIIGIMAGEKYRGAIWAVPPIAISLYVQYYTSIFLYLDFYHEIKVYMNIATISAAVINVILNWIFIPYVGFVGAAYTTLASYIVFEIISFISYKKISKRYGYKEDLFEIKELFLIQLVVLMLGLALMLLYKFFIIRLFLIITGIVAVYFCRKTIIDVVRRIKMNESNKE